MCGRYVIKSAPETLRQTFGYRDVPNFPARYNIAPTQPVPIVRMWEGERRFVLVRWGLIPAWVEDPRNFAQLHNARAESVLDKPAFRAAMRYRRCLFIADGFYEWRDDGGGRKTPHFVCMADGAPMGMAGLWESWMGPNGEEVESAAVITTDANRTLAHVHHRMPVIVPPEGYDRWLDCGAVDAPTAARLLVPAPDAAVRVHPVSAAVNRAANDSAELIAEAVPTATEPPPRSPRAKKTPDDDRQPSLF